MHYPETQNDDAERKRAADWFVHLHSQSPTTEDVAAWQQWLAADEAHRQEFSQIEDLWQTMGYTAAHFRERQPARRRKWPIALAASVLVAVLGVSSYVWRWSVDSVVLPASAAVETQIAERRSYRLADGSRVEVGAQSGIIVDFSPSARSVIIDSGEAYFDVAHDTRPFIVRAGGGTITAMGTAFAVRHLQGRVTVTVVEGSVNVQEFPADAASVEAADSGANAREPLPAPTHTVVRAGEGVAYGHAPQPRQRVDTAVATAWRTGHLQYIREPLQYVVPDVERYTGMRILIADPAVGGLLYTGTVLHTEVEEWFAILSAAFKVDAVRIDRRTVLLKAHAEAIDNPVEHIPRK